MTQFWSRDGKPMELLEWATTYEQARFRVVAVDSDGPGQPMVSTIWEGMARPLILHDDVAARGIFETAFIGDEGKIVETVDNQARSDTEEEALAQHRAYCLSYLGREPRPEDGHVQMIIDNEREAREK